MTAEGLALRVLSLSFTVGLLPQTCRQDVCAPSYLHLLYPQSRQKSHPLACSSWPRHSGQVAIIEDMIVGPGVRGRGSVTAADFDARAESGWPFRRRLVIIMHSATACSGEVSRRSLNQTAWVPVT